MTLELKQYNYNHAKPYRLGGVKDITDKTNYGDGYVSITIFDTRTFIIDSFEYVKDIDSGEYYVKNGEWVGE